MKNKKLIRLTEADLHRIVKESVNKVLNEGGFDYTLGNDVKKHVEKVDTFIYANKKVKLFKCDNGDDYYYYCVFNGSPCRSAKTIDGAIEKMKEDVI